MVVSFDALSRDVYCLLGIPVDNICMEKAVDRVDEAIRKKTPLLLATPNINFVVNAMHDDSFRQSMMLSDLCIPDGAWFVFLGRMLGIPIKERVAGSDILEALKSRRTSADPVKVFIFGGSDSAGRQANDAINARNDGLRCTGWVNPGFGSVEQMSAEEALSAVNESQSDFLLVALGAQKGQMWLQRNHSRLSVSGRAHLGAAINFYSGLVKRAPRLLQDWGLEWAWRIKEEPYLWRRYAYDAAMVASMFFNRVAPLLLWTFVLRLRSLFAADDLALSLSSGCGPRVISLGGTLTANNIAAIASGLRSAMRAGEDLTVDLSGVRAVDARFAGLLFMLQKTMAERGGQLRFVDAPFFIRGLLGLYGFDIPGRAPEINAAPGVGVTPRHEMDSGCGVSSQLERQGSPCSVR